jgi:hypothetical protein
MASAAQVPSEQESVVQAFWSLQSPSVVQGTQPGMSSAAQEHTEKETVVQAFWSLQSPSVGQGMQPGMASAAQVPSEQESVVQAFWSLAACGGGLAYSCSTSELARARTSTRATPKTRAGSCACAQRPSRSALPATGAPT